MRNTSNKEQQHQTKPDGRKKNEAKKKKKAHINLKFKVNKFNDLENLYSKKWPWQWHW